MMGTPNLARRFRSTDSAPPGDRCHDMVRARATRNWRRPVVHALGMALFACLSGLAAPNGPLSAVHAQERMANANAPLRYRLIFAPPSQIEKMARGEYRPMRRDAFDRRVQALQLQVPPEIAQGVALRQARYTARLEGRRLLVGTATWEIEREDEASSAPGDTEIVEPLRGDTLAWLSLGHMNLALSDPRWLVDARPAATRLEADLGKSFDGASLLAVSHSGTVQARWTLAPSTAPGPSTDASDNGRGSTDEDWTFDLRLPPCPVSRLDLQLPSDLELTVDGGVVRPIPLSQDPAAAESGAGVTPQVNLWQIDLGGRHRCQLRFRRQNAPRPQVRLRQLTRYSVSEHGLDVTADLVLDCDEVELERLELRADSPLRITKIVHESQSLAWSESGAADEARVTSVEFRQPLSGLNRTVRISAVAPPDIAADWQLPRIRVVGVDWLQESARLQIHPPLVLQDLQLTYGLRLRTTDDGGPGRQTVAIQFFDPEHRVQLRLGPEVRPAAFKTATTVTVGPNELSAAMEVDARSRSADQFDAEATLEEGWNLEAVEAAETDVLDQWQVETSPGGGRTLRLRFRRPLASESWTRLKVRARRPFKPGPEPVPIRQLRPLRFDEDQPVPRQFLMIPPQAGVEVRYPHDGRITWLSLDDLDAGETRLLGTQRRERLVLLDRQSLAETVILDEATEQLAPVTARLETTVQLSRRELRERLKIELLRPARPPQHFHVQLSQSRPSDIRWTLESAPQQELSAERVARGDVDAVGEQWRIAWPETSDKTLVVVGERSWPTSDGGPIALARVLEADTQEGIVVVEGAADIDLSLHAPPLFVPLPVPATSFRQFEVSRYRYRYTPDADIFSPDNWMIVSTSIPTNAGSRLLVWRQLLETHLDQSGVYRAEVRLWTENLGADRLRMRLPPDSLLRQTYVDSQEITTDSDLQGWLEIPLPAGERFPLVRVRYDQPGRGLRWLQRLRYEAPQLTAPVLHRQWDVWTPPDYSLSIAGARSGAVTAGWLPPRLRSADRRPFNLFSPVDWQWQLNRLLQPNDELTRPLAQALAELGNSQQLTAGGWLRALATQRGLDVRVDAAGLAELGIQPATPLPVSTSIDDVLRGIDRLRQMHLSLLELDGTLWVSSESALAEVPGATLSRATASVARLNGPAADAWRQLVRRSAPDRLHVATDWQTRPPTWQMEPVERAPYLATGWRLHHVPLANRAEVTVYRAVTWRVLGSASFLAAFAFTWWTARLAPRRALFAPIACLAAALLGPSPLAGLAAHALAGSTLGWFVPRFRRLTVEPRNSGGSEARRVTAAACVGASLMLVGAGSTASAQPTPTDDAPALEVFVPADERGAPQGEHLFVPLELQRRLLATRGVAPPAWVLARATYTGVLEPQTDASQLELSTITADFELHVARLGGAVQFPLAAAAVTALKREAFLDGRRIQLQWDANRSTLAIPMSQAGRHHLQLSFQTLTTTEEGRARVELPIPSTPWATLVLTSPQDPQSIEVPSARGAIQRREATGQVIAELGPTERLRIEWPTTPSRPPEPAIHQLSWLRVERDEVRYDVQLIPDLARVPDASLVLEVDERLQLDVALSDQPLSLAPANERGVRRLEFDLIQTDSDSPVIQLSFVLTGSTGIGRVRLPRCRVLNQSVRHWLAVSADPRLGLRADTAVTLPIDEFVTHWGSGKSPDFAYELPAVASHWSCEGQWIESQPNVEIQEAHVVGREGTRMLLVATFRADDQELFQQALEVPEGLQIESIQRLPSAMGTPLRWSRYASDRVTVFFDDPPVGTFQIGILGYHPDDRLPDRPLPRIEFPRTRIDRRQVDIFRDGDVVIQGLPAAGGKSAPEIAPFLRSQLGLARWQIRRESPEEVPGTVTLQPNERRLRAQMDSVIAREQGNWVHRLHAHVDVEQGVLDSLTFELPEAWTAGLRESAQMRITYAQASQPGMVRVTFWPQLQPLDDVPPILFAGQIPVSAGQPLTVPNIRLLDEGQIERRIFLPSRLEGQAILWSVSGLEPLDDVEVPAALAQPDASYVPYRIPAGPFQAVRLPASTTVDHPAVSLLDLQIAWQDEGRYEAVAMFDLQPDGLDECLLVFPAGVTPVALYVDELPVRLHERAAGIADDKLAQTITLSSHDLPQRIRVLLAGRTAAGAADGERTILLPRLGYRAEADASFQQIPVAEMLCSLHRLTPGTLQLGGQPLSGTELGLRRLTHLADVFEQAALLATDYTATDLEHWYSVWGRRYFVAQQRLQSPGVQSSSDMSQAVQQARKRHAAVLPQLKVDTVFQRLQAEGELSDSLGVWLDAMPAALEVQHRAISSAPSELTVQFQPAANTSRTWTLAGLLAAVAAGLAVQRWPRSPQEFAPRWPMLAGVLLGLAWWLWLEPSLLGWAIVGLSLLVMLLLP